MADKIIDGRKIAAEILGQLKTKNVAGKLKLRLTAVSVGADGKLRKFIELKKRAAENIGIEFNCRNFKTNSSQSNIISEIKRLACTKSVSGIFVELPIPKKFNTGKILNAIPPEKDVDVLSAAAQGKFFAGESSILPPAVEAVKIIFEKYGISLKGKRAAVFGYGLLTGRPAVHWLAASGAAVTTINEFTKNPGGLSKNADIIVSGVGKHDLIKREMVKRGAVVVDFGYNTVNGKLCGDVDFAAVSKKAGLITPVPGGVGPIVIAAVFQNLVKLTVNKK